MYKVFKSGIDKLVILRSIIMLIVPPILLYLNDEWQPQMLFGVTIFEVLIMLPFGIILPLTTTYKITNDGQLIVPTGIRKIKININDIASIKTKNSWGEFIFTSYVNSLDQLKLFYEKSSSITISPDNKEEFIKLLHNQNPNIALG